MNGPSATLLQLQDALVGFSDRIKLLPLVVGEHDQRSTYRDEAAIRPWS